MNQLQINTVYQVLPNEFVGGWGGHSDQISNRNCNRLGNQIHFVVFSYLRFINPDIRYDL